jgi:hypothetical protein
MLSVWALQSRWVAVMMAIAPLAVLVMFIVARTLVHQPIVGPDPASWFRRVGFEISYGVPLVLVALTFVGYAIRDGSSALAFAAGPLFNVAATMIVLVRIAHRGEALDAVAWITVAQVNAIVSSIVALIWQASVVWHRKKLQTVAGGAIGERGGARTTGSEPPHLLVSLSARWPLLLVSQVALGAILVSTFTVPAAVRLATMWSPPAVTLVWVSVAGGAIGWLALGLSTAAVIWLVWGQRVGQALVAMLVAAFVSIVALTVLRQSGDHQEAFHTLMAGSCLAAWLLPVATVVVNRLMCRTDSTELANYSWAAWPARTFGIVTVWLVLWEYSAAASWWVVLAIAAIGARNVVIAWREDRRGSMWIAASLVLFAAGVWWLDLLKKAATMNGIGDFFAFLWFEILVGAALAIVSVVAERRQITTERLLSELNKPSASGRSRQGLVYHRFAAWAFVALLLFTTGAGLIADVMNESFAILSRLHGHLALPRPSRPPLACGIRQFVGR